MGTEFQETMRDLHAWPQWLRCRQEQKRVLLGLRESGCGKRSQPGTRCQAQHIPEPVGWGGGTQGDCRAPPELLPWDPGQGRSAQAGTCTASVEPQW